METGRSTFRNRNDRCTSETYEMESTDGAKADAGIGSGSRGWRKQENATLETFLRKAEALRAKMEEEETRGRERALASLNGIQSTESSDDEANAGTKGTSSQQAGKVAYVSLRFQVEGLDTCVPGFSKKIHLRAKNFSQSECRPREVQFSRAATGIFEGDFDVLQEGWLKFEGNKQKLLLELWMPESRNSAPPKLLGIVRLALKQRTRTHHGWRTSEATELWDPMLGKSQGSLKFSCLLTFPRSHSVRGADMCKRSFSSNLRPEIPNGNECQEKVEISVLQIDNLGEFSDAVAWSVGYAVEGAEQFWFQEAVPHDLPMKPGFKLRFSLSARGIYTGREQGAVGQLRLALACHTANGTVLCVGTCTLHVAAVLAGLPAAKSQHTCFLQLEPTKNKPRNSTRSIPSLLPSLEVCLRRVHDGYSGGAMLGKTHPIASGTLVLRVLRLGNFRHALTPSQDLATGACFWKISIQLCPESLTSEGPVEASVGVNDHCTSIGLRQDLYLSLSEDELCQYANGHLLVRLYWNCSDGSKDTKVIGQTCIPTLATILSPHGIFGWHPLTDVSGDEQQVRGVVEIQARFVSFNGKPLRQGASPLQLFPCYHSLLPMHATLGLLPETPPDAPATLNMNFGYLHVPEGLDGSGKMTLLYKLPGQEKFTREYFEVILPLPVQQYQLQHSCSHLYQSISTGFLAAADEQMIVEIWFSSISRPRAAASPLGSLIGAVRFDVWMALSSAFSGQSEKSEMHRLLLVNPCSEVAETPTLEMGVSLVIGNDTLNERSNASGSNKPSLATEKKCHAANQPEGRAPFSDQNVHLTIHQVSNLAEPLVGQLLYIKARGPCFATGAQTRLVRASREKKAPFCFRKTLRGQIATQEKSLPSLQLSLVERRCPTECSSFLLEAEPAPSDQEIAKVHVPLPNVGGAVDNVQPMYDEAGNLIAHLHATLVVESVHQGMV